MVAKDHPNKPLPYHIQCFSSSFEGNSQSPTQQPGTKIHLASNTRRNLLNGGRKRYIGITCPWTGELRTRPKRPLYLRCSDSPGSNIYSA
ncbi:hypothetical protein ACN42_g11026 [Penicillium freii]|uniref:Uncharacterized protein n=1 Tax=Penicillium freii TaxID=48697 RepID=A0A124GPV9_PENFR|nr:hypothetical protein ACN42_g11026 [Penicillium freii]